MDERQALLEEIVIQSRLVMLALAEHGQSIVPHLLDSDDNAGERLRNALDDLEMYDNEHPDRANHV